MYALTVVIITFNEERNIARCIGSVQGLGDEIVVVDSGSSDETVNISLSMGARVIHHDFAGYIEQKNFATEAAENDWILCLDADEELSEELKAAVMKVLVAPQSMGFSMNRLTNYCGDWVRHGGWYPDVKLRLYNRKYGSWQGVNPHDRFILKENKVPLHLQGDLLHYSYISLSDHLKQIDRFSSIGAKSLFDKGVKGGILKIIYKPIARFIRNYILRRGFLDGITGFIIAVNSAHAVFLKYLRLYYLHKGKSI